MARIDCSAEFDLYPLRIELRNTQSSCGIPNLHQYFPHSPARTNVEVDGPGYLEVALIALADQDRGREIICQRIILSNNPRYLESRRGLVNLHTSVLSPAYN